MRKKKNEDAMIALSFVVRYFFFLIKSLDGATCQMNREVFFFVAGVNVDGFRWNTTVHLDSIKFSLLMYLCLFSFRSVARFCVVKLTRNSMIQSICAKLFLSKFENNAEVM